MSRRRWVYPADGSPPHEVGADWTDAPVSTGDLDKFAYDGLKASDGTPIDSPQKRREYMKREGVVDVRDFTEALPKAKAALQANAACETRAWREEAKRDAYQAIQQLRNRGRK